MKTRLRFGFRHKLRKDGTFQLPLFMVVREYYDEDNQLVWAKVVFMIKGKQMKKIQKRKDA